MYSLRMNSKFKNAYFRLPNKILLLQEFNQLDLCNILWNATKRIYKFKIKDKMLIFTVARQKESMYFPPFAAKTHC